MVEISTEKFIDRLLREAREKDQKGKTGSLTQTPSTPARDRYDLITTIIREKPFFDNFKSVNTLLDLENNREIEKQKILKPQEKFIEKEINLLSLFPNISKNIFPMPIRIQYNPNRINFNVSPQTGITFDSKTGITADNIAEFAYPLAQFIHQARPDYIIACDRGARIIALAVHMMYGELYGALPTQDHRISFRKISGKLPKEFVRAAIRPDVQRMLVATESPTVLVLDDWVLTGGTRNMVRELFDELSGGKINLLYGVIRGSGADVSGKQDSGALGDWNDRPDLIGVDYDAFLLKPHKVDSLAAIAYRKQMATNISKYIADLCTPVGARR